MKYSDLYLALTDVREHECLIGSLMQFKSPCDMLARDIEYVVKEEDTFVFEEVQSQRTDFLKCTKEKCAMCKLRDSAQ